MWEAEPAGRLPRRNAPNARSRKEEHVEQAVLHVGVPGRINPQGVMPAVGHYEPATLPIDEAAIIDVDLQAWQCRLKEFAADRSEVRPMAAGAGAAIGESPDDPRVGAHRDHQCKEPGCTTNPSIWYGTQRAYIHELMAIRLYRCKYGLRIRTHAPLSGKQVFVADANVINDRS